VGIVFLSTAIYFVLTPATKVTSEANVFGFSASYQQPADLPELRRFKARDGSQLAYRFYDSTSEKQLFFFHGSSYHSVAYHALAQAISSSGLAKVYMPNLRGHYLSGVRRGDVDYIGQLEDDIADLISFARDQGEKAEIYLGGHSSGAGLAIRFAGGKYADVVNGYVLLAPVIPLAPSVKGGDAGGWANVNQNRLYGLLALNAVGISGFNGLPIIEFNKPEKFWDGTETLSYSYRLNTSYHPRYDYVSDITLMGDKVLVLVGEEDEAIDTGKLKALFEDATSGIEVAILPGVNHFGIFTDPSAFKAIRSLFEK
jgi:non-heme chloroperoxidase